MLKRLTKKKDDKDREAAGKLLNLELSEITEISAKLFSRLEKRMKELASIEQRLDTKIAILEKLILRAERADIPSHRQQDDRYHEIAELIGKGLKVDEIANILDIPMGEIELIVSLRK